MAENISDAFLCTAANGIMVEKIWINQLFSENVLLKIILCYLKNYIMLFKMSFSNLNHIFIKKKSLYYSQAIIWIQIQMVLFLLVFQTIRHSIVRWVCFFNINWWYHNSVLHLHWRTKFSSGYTRPCFPFDCIFSHFSQLPSTTSPNCLHCSSSHHWKSSTAPFSWSELLAHSLWLVPSLNKVST